MESAIKEKFFAEVRWSLEDVMDAAAEHGIGLTKQQAYNWWKQNEDWFRDCLTERGNEILADIDFGKELL